MGKRISVYKKVVLPVACLAMFFIFETGKSYGEAPLSNQAVSAPGNNGTITGVVRFPESYPEREKITITKDHAVCGAFQYSEDFVVSETDHGLMNVVVSLLEVQEKIKAPPGSTATLEQQGCRFVPHVQAVPAGTVLEIVNNDGILHNIHAYTMEPKRTLFNKAQPKVLKKIKQPLRRSGMYSIQCDVHNHMSAFIAVMDHPFYSVTDENGSYTLSDVPPGTYKIQAWHEVLGALEKEVTVQSGQTVEIVFDIIPNQ